MKLTYWGHSCFLVETATHRLVIDPFLSDAAPVKAGDVACDYILLSHGHDDHVGSALEISQRTGATILGNFELTEYLGAKGAKVDSLNPGGAVRTPFGRVKLTLAHHSSSIMDAQGRPIYLGTPCGLLIEADGQRLYHAGDTALFLDMQLIGRGGLDAALLPIGDRFTMGPEDAVEALDLLKPKVAVPMHYNTWPPIAQDPAAFARAAAARGHAVKVLAPGQSLAL